MNFSVKNKTKKENGLIEKWLSEMQLILAPLKPLDDETVKSIRQHIEKCYLVREDLITKSMFFLLDNFKLKYLFISSSATQVLGYDQKEMCDNGFEWIFTLLSETELEYKKNVMKDVHHFLGKLNSEEVFSCTVRYDIVATKKDGTEIHLLEEMMFPQVDKDGNPLITSCFLHDITTYGNRDQRQCNIYVENAYSQEVIFSKTYYVGIKKKSPLSRRETEILEQFSNGYTTTQVARKLFVSENTIKTHRKNILLKLKVQNTAEAIKTALKNNWVS